MNPYLASIGHVCLLIALMLPQDFRKIGEQAAADVFYGRHEAAEAGFSEALRLMEQNAPHDPYLAVLLSNRATMYTKLAKYKESRKTLERALEVAEKRLPKDHPHFATIFTNLAALAQRQEKWAIAEAHLLRAMRIVDLYPENRRDRALTLEHLGIVHYKQGKMSQAESELRRALDIERNIESDSIRTANVSLNLARMLARRGEYEEARLLYGAALPIQERVLGPNNAELASTLEMYSDLLKTLKSREAAEEMQARAKKIRTVLAYTIAID